MKPEIQVVIDDLQERRARLAGVIDALRGFYGFPEPTHGNGKPTQIREKKRKYSRAKPAPTNRGGRGDRRKAAATQGHDSKHLDTKADDQH